MTTRIDPALGGPSGGAAPPPLGSSESPLARSAAAAARPFLVEGERLAVTGSEIAGQHAFWLGSRLVARDLQAEGGLAANAVASPGALLRELVGRHGSLLESTLVAPSLPLAAVQWRRPSGGGGPTTLGIALTVLPGEEQVRYGVGESGARFNAAGPDGLVVEVLVHPSPAEISVGEGAAGGAELRLAVSLDGPVTIVVAAGTREATARALEAVPHLAAHETRASWEWDPARMETLAARTGVREVDHAVAWAAARVRGSLLRGGGADAGALFRAGMGALAIGDVEAAARAVEALAGCPEAAVGPWPGGGLVPAGLLGTLLAARLTLLTGDPDPAVAALRRLPQNALAHRGAPGVRGGAGGAWAATREALADALRHGAPASEVATLRALPFPWPMGETRVHLHMAGSPPLPPLPWTPWSDGEPDQAWAAWRTTLAAGLERGGPWGRGTWDSEGLDGGGDPRDDGDPSESGAGAGLLLCGFAHGLLGTAPDAPSHRIRIAPALPGHLTGFAVRGIRVGDVRLALEYRREGTVHRFTLEPTDGRVPAMVILEPSVPTPTVGTVRVDGTPAQLEVTPRGGRSVVRIQLPLDAPRCLEIEAGA